MAPTPGFFAEPVQLVNRSPQKSPVKDVELLENFMAKLNCPVKIGFWATVLGSVILIVVFSVSQTAQITNGEQSQITLTENESSRSSVLCIWNGICLLFGYDP